MLTRIITRRFLYCLLASVIYASVGAALAQNPTIPTRTPTPAPVQPSPTTSSGGGGGEDEPSPTAVPPTATQISIAPTATLVSNPTATATTAVTATHTPTPTATPVPPTVQPTAEGSYPAAPTVATQPAGYPLGELEEATEADIEAALAPTVPSLERVGGVETNSAEPTAPAPTAVPLATSQSSTAPDILPIVGLLLLAGGIFGFLFWRQRQRSEQS